MKAPSLLYERMAPTLSIHLKSAEGDGQARWPWDRMLAKPWAAEASKHTAGGIAELAGGRGPPIGQGCGWWRRLGARECWLMAYSMHQCGRYDANNSVARH